MWKTGDLCAPLSVRLVVVRSGANNIDNDEPKVIENSITKIGQIFQEKCSVFYIILTGFLPRDLHKPKQRNTISKVSSYVKKLCKNEQISHYLEQNLDWVPKDQ